MSLHTMRPRETATAKGPSLATHRASALIITAGVAHGELPAQHLRLNFGHPQASAGKEEHPGTNPKLLRTPSSQATPGFHTHAPLLRRPPPPR
jgi:hypothetical protein